MIQAICLERQHKLQVIYAPTGTVTPHLPKSGIGGGLFLRFLPLIKPHNSES